MTIASTLLCHLPDEQRSLASLWLTQRAIYAATLSDKNSSEAQLEHAAAEIDDIDVALRELAREYMPRPIAAVPA
jgi:hypothetical protein